MGYDKQKLKGADPNGPHLRLYAKIYDSPAWKALSAPDMLAYLALGRELKGSNNGNLCLTLVRAKVCGIGHHVTLARALRALCAVGLVAITAKGGCKKGGQRQPTLYRFTHLDSSEFSNRYVEAVKESNEWKRITSAAHGRALIQAADDNVKVGTAKTKGAGHVVTTTVSPCVLVKPKTRTPRDPWPDGPGHVVTMAEKSENPAFMRVAGGFSVVAEKAIHRSPTRPPLQVAIHSNRTACTDGHGAYQRLREQPVGLFTRLLVVERRAA